MAVKSWPSPDVPLTQSQTKPRAVYSNLLRDPSTSIAVLPPPAQAAQTTCSSRFARRRASSHGRNV